MRALLRRLSLLCLAACTAGDAPDLPDGAVGTRALDGAQVGEPLAESEGHPVWFVRRRLPDGRALVQDAEGVFVGGEQVGADPVSAVVVSDDGRRIVFADRVDGDPVTRLVRCERGCEVLVSEGHPDRVALSADGAMVAYVAAADGLPAVFVVPFDGGTPVQLTNVDLPRQLPGEPVGFVPPPESGPLRFEGGELVWSAQGQTYRVAWR